MPQILVFALRDDWLHVLKAVEGSRGMAWFKMGPHATPQVNKLRSGTLIPKLGRAAGDQHMVCEEYLVAERPYALTIRPVTASDGVTRHYVDQMVNPHTITVTPAGLWAEGVVIAGRVATLYDSPRAKSLMSAFRSSITKPFTKVRASWVGPAAGEILATGGRLCHAVESPAEYDLHAED